MIQNSFLIAIILILIEIVVLCISEHKHFKKYFHFLPAVFWIYFLPMIFSTFHIIPAKSPVYSTISTYVLPASLILLLLGVDIPAILKLGKKALFMMFAGSLGIIVGAPIVIILFRPWLHPDVWMGFAALSGSWTGGSANMIAVKEAIQVPDSVFLPMVIVDVVVAYSWMGILIALAAFQNRYDQWNQSDKRIIEGLNVGVRRAVPLQPIKNLSAQKAGLILSTAFIGVIVSIYLAEAIHESPLLSSLTGFSISAWIILIASALGISASFTRFKKLESYGASKIGYWLLYLVLASIGAKANLNDIAEAPMLIAAGFLIVLIHTAFLFAASRITKSPMCLLATASQANIGGPVSAPIVAAIYHPELAPVGLLLGIFGNIIGTYAGLLCAQILRWICNT